MVGAGPNSGACRSGASMRKGGGVVLEIDACGMGFTRGKGVGIACIICGMKPCGANPPGWWINMSSCLDKAG